MASHLYTQTGSFSSNLLFINRILNWENRKVCIGVWMFEGLLFYSIAKCLKENMNQKRYTGIKLLNQFVTLF